MKKFTKYAMLMAVAIIAALQLGACKGSDDAAINDIVNELKEHRSRCRGQRSQRRGCHQAEWRRSVVRHDGAGNPAADEVERYTQRHR